MDRVASAALFFCHIFCTFRTKIDVLKNLCLFAFIVLSMSCTHKQSEVDIPDGYPYYAQAFSYLEFEMTDSAFLVFNQAKDVFVEAQDSLNIANCLINMAIIQREQGDYFGAQEVSLQAMDYLDESSPEHRIYLSTNYNNLATATDHLRNYGEAISFYELAIRFSDDSLNTLVYKNNLAIAYQRVERYEDALHIFGEILPDANQIPREYARILSNFASTKWRQDSSYQAMPKFLTALKIREDENDLWGQNASLAHLADYYARKKIDSALYYAHRQYVIAKKIKRADERLRALDRLIRFSNGNAAKSYFETYKALNDSVQQARAAAKNQFALIRYEVEKNKAQNLQLEKENTEKAFHLARQRIWTGGVTVVFIIFAVGGTYWYRKRRQRLELEAQHQVKAVQLKTSRKVHDVVANGIYRVMTEIEHREDIDRENILDSLEDMYHKSRDISYEAKNQIQAEMSYSERIAKLLKPFATETRRILIVGNEAELWQTISRQAQDEIEQVLQELMVNMRKHSQANDVVIQFGLVDDTLHMHYRDDGIGMSESVVHGNGLVNTGNRIKDLGGRITFVSETGRGLQVDVSIPFS